MEAVIDTNVLVYETIEDSEHHAETVDKLEALDRAHIPTNVLVEYALVLWRLGLDIKLIAGKMLGILSNPNAKLEPLTPADFAAATHALEKRRASPKRINDRLVLAVAQRLRLPLYTYDKRLAAQTTEHGVSLL